MKLLSLKTILFSAAALLSLTQGVQAKEERVVAVVDGYMIMESQVRHALGKKADNAKNRQAALELVIDDYLVQRAIQQSGAKVSWQQVDMVIEDIARQNGLTYGQFLDVLDYQNITLNQYRQQLAQQMMMEQVRQASIGQSIRVDRNEVDSLAQDMLNKAKTSGNLKTVKGTEHRVSHILLKLNPILNDKQAQQKLKEITADIKAGKTTFEEAAKKHSVDYASGADGGDLGWNLLDIYDPAFANVAAKSKVGVISAPFKSQFGWHILKVTDTRAADRTEDAYYQRAYEQIVNKQAQEASKDWVKALRKTADIQYINKP